MKLPIPRDLIINFAGMIFLGVAGFVGWEMDGWQHLRSAKGIGFLVVGVVATGALVGWPLGRLHRLYCMKLIHRQQGELTPAAMQTIRYSGTALMVFQIVVVYLLTEAAYTWLFPVARAA